MKEGEKMLVSIYVETIKMQRKLRNGEIECSSHKKATHLALQLRCVHVHYKHIHYMPIFHTETRYKREMNINFEIV